MTKTVTEPSPAYDVAILGPLVSGVIAHRRSVHFLPTGKFHGKDELKQAIELAACTEREARCYSWAWARQHGAMLCPDCFGGAA